MGIYTKVLNEALFKKNNRDKYKEIEQLANSFIKECKSPFFFSAKINKKSFKDFCSEKTNKFNVDFYTNIAKPSIIKSTFKDDIIDKQQDKFEKLQKQIKTKFNDSNIEIKLLSTAQLQVILK